MTREKYFGAMRAEHMAELEALDNEYIKGRQSSFDSAQDDRIKEIENAQLDCAHCDTEITNLAEVHVLNDAEERYANFLTEEFAKNNRSKELKS